MSKRARPGASLQQRRPGKFIVLEGLDGAGTTTLLKGLQQTFAQRGLAIHATAEPSGGPLGLLLRQALGRKVTQKDGEPLAEDALALMFRRK